MTKHNMMFRFIALLFIPATISAQKIKGTSQEFKWSTARVVSGAGVDNKHLIKYQFDRFVLPVTEKEKIIPVSRTRGWGIVRLNDDGKALWEFEGRATQLMGIGLMGNNVIAFSANDAEKPKKITATLINGTTGNELSEKAVYESSSPAKTDIRVQNKPNGVFHDLILITDEKKAGFSVQFLYINDQLVASAQVLAKPSSVFTSFAGSLVDNSGDIAVADFSDDQFVVSKFDKDGKELKKLSTPVTRRSDDFETILQPDKNDEEAVIATANYKDGSKDWVVQLLRFDFASGKAISSQPEILDKGHAKSIALTTIKGVTDGNLNWINAASIAGTVQWQNKYVVIKEIRTSTITERNTRHVNDAWIASIYDSGLNLEKTFGLDKRHESFIEASLSLGFGIQKDKLVIVAPALAGLGLYAATLVSVNMQTGEIEKAIAINELKVGSKPIEAGATLWFNDKFLLQQLHAAGSFLNRTSNCTFYKVEM